MIAIGLLPSLNYKKIEESERGFNSSPAFSEIPKLTGNAIYKGEDPDFSGDIFGHDGATHHIYEINPPFNHPNFPDEKFSNIVVATHGGSYPRSTMNQWTPRGMLNNYGVDPTSPKNRIIPTEVKAFKITPAKGNPGDSSYESESTELYPFHSTTNKNEPMHHHQVMKNLGFKIEIPDEVHPGARYYNTPSDTGDLFFKNK